MDKINILYGLGYTPKLFKDFRMIDMSSDKRVLCTCFKKMIGGMEYVDIKVIDDIKELNVPNIYCASLNINIDKKYKDEIKDSKGYIFIPRTCNPDDIYGMFGFRGVQYCKDVISENKVKGKNYLYTPLEYVNILCSNSFGEKVKPIHIVNGFVELNDSNEIKGYMRQLNSSDNAVINRGLDIDKVYSDEKRIRSFKIDGKFNYYAAKLKELLEKPVIKKKKEKI